MLLVLKTKKTTFVANSSTRNCVIASNGIQGKTSLFRSLNRYTIKLNGDKLLLRDYLYINEDDTFFREDVLIYNAYKEIDYNYYDKKLLIFDDTSNKLEENFIKFLVSVLKNTTFIVISRSFVCSNFSVYKFNLSNRENIIEPYLFKKGYSTCRF